MAKTKEVKEVKHRTPKAAKAETAQVSVEKPSAIVAKPLPKDPRGSLEERVGRLEAIVKRHGLGLGG